jgi:hypothetical protein
MALIGTVTLKAEPLPISDWTMMWPPCSSTMRPRDRQAEPCAALFCACWCYRPAGTRRRFAPDRPVPMPGPESTTDISKRSPACTARISTPPWSVNLMAFADQVQQHLGEAARIAGANRQAGTPRAEPSLRFLARASDSVAP